MARPGEGCRGCNTPPIIGNFYYFAHLKDRKVKIQQGSVNSFPKDTELKEVFLEQAIK